jgi:hypothetical protein
VHVVTAILLAAIVLAGAITAIAGATRDHEELPGTSGSVAIVLRVDNRFTTRTPVRTAESLFMACRHTLSDRYRATAFLDAGGGHITFTISPSFGPQAARRLQGCLEDAVIDRISASVLSLDQRP